MGFDFQLEIVPGSTKNLDFLDFALQLVGCLHASWTLSCRTGPQLECMCITMVSTPKPRKQLEQPIWEEANSIFQITKNICCSPQIMAICVMET